MFVDMRKLKPSLDRRDHARGVLTAPIQLVEFGDYECPFCGKAAGVVERLIEALGGRLCFGFRHFPLVGAHPQAMIAAEAAEAAGAEGRYWEMHEMLFRHQDALVVPALDKYATALGLDLKHFTHDLRMHVHLDKIRADLHSGAISGVSGTPTFFINGYRHDGAIDFDSLYGALTEAGVAAGLPL
jgi:protein-disulfide isomerase